MKNGLWSCSGPLGALGARRSAWWPPKPRAQAMMSHQGSRRPHAQCTWRAEADFGTRRAERCCAETRRTSPTCSTSHRTAHASATPSRPCSRRRGAVSRLGAAAEERYDSLTPRTQAIESQRENIANFLEEQGRVREAAMKAQASQASTASGAPQRVTLTSPSATAWLIAAG